MVLFKDLAKSSTDLLTRDFPHDKPWDVEVKCKRPNPQFINCASATATAGVDASSSMKYTGKDVNSELKVTAGGGALLDLNCSLAKYIQGLTLGSRLERKSTAKSSADSVEVSCEYENGRLHSKTQFNPLATTFTTSALVTCNRPDNIVVGGELTGGVDMSALKYALGGSYTQKLFQGGRWTLALRATGDVEHGLNRILCNVYNTTVAIPANNSSSKPYYGPSELGMEVRHSLEDGKTNLQFGGLWYLDKERDTSVKAKIGQDAKLAVALSHCFSSSATAVLGMQVDTMKMGNADSTKYGLKLYLKA